MTEMLSTVYRYTVPAICLVVVIYCIVHLLRSKAPDVTPAYLIDELTDTKYEITSWETSIGRSNACDIVLDYPTVSRFHAVISKHKKGWVVTDTHSASGTFVARKKAEKPMLVNDGDNISFGGIVLRFRVR